jgi:hypothetical protein
MVRSLRQDVAVPIAITTRPHRICPRCNKSISIKNNGSFRSHHIRGNDSPYCQAVQQSQVTEETDDHSSLQSADFADPLNTPDFLGMIGNVDDDLPVIVPVETAAHGQQPEVPDVTPGIEQMHIRYKPRDERKVKDWSTTIKMILIRLELSLSDNSDNASMSAIVEEIYEHPHPLSKSFSLNQNVNINEDNLTNLSELSFQGVDNRDITATPKQESELWRAMRNGNIPKARRVMTSNGIADISCANVRTKIQSKYPQGRQHLNHIVEHTGITISTKILRRVYSRI